MPIAPERYASASARELLDAAARGHVGLDRRWIGALLNASLDEIVAFANEDRSQDRVDVSLDLIRLFAARPTGAAVPFLVTEIRRFPEDVPDEMAEAVARIGEPAIGPLIETRDPVEDVGFLLAVMGVRDDRIARFLRDLLKADAAEGAFLCGLYGDPALRDDLEAVREAAPDAVAEALEQLDEPAPRDLEPYDIEADYPDEAEPDVAHLPENEQAEFIESESAELRAAGVAAWANRELEPGQIDRLFEIACNDADTRVRGLAWEALRLESHQDRIRQAARAVLANDVASPDEQAGAAIALSSIDDAETLRVPIEALYERQDTRARALEAMWRTESRLFADHVARHLDDPDREVREEAIYGVGFLGLAGELKRLEALFENEDFRADALFSWVLASPGQSNRTGLQQLRKRVEELAGGLAEDEEEIVDAAIEIRRQRAGKPEQKADEEAPAKTAKVGRNELCPCGSGRKYKKCCGAA
ncbi:MAG: SEC-C metal-binding domain-containing protein [Bryobacteraceae bacterium]